MLGCSQVVKKANAITAVVSVVCINMSSFICGYRPEASNEHNHHSHSYLHNKSRVVITKKWVYKELISRNANSVSYDVNHICNSILANTGGAFLFHVLK